MLIIDTTKPTKSAIPFQLEIARFVISDYVHNMYVFWYEYPQIQRSDYYVLFVNCHMYRFFGATLTPSFAVHDMLACIDYLLV